MPKFAANITLLFQELPFLERIAAARRAGFKAVEILTPYDAAADEIAKVLTEQEMPLALINSPAGDWGKGERGMAALPARVTEFREGFLQALEFAEVAQPERIHIMAGLASGSIADGCFRENLAWACQQAPERQFLIEPISVTGCAGYFLNDFTQAAGIIQDLALPNLHLQFDVFHAAQCGLDPLAAFERYLPTIRHVQISSVPDRHEPDHGTVDYPDFFRYLDASAYQGWVAAEYLPKGDTLAGLSWLGKYSSLD